MTLALYQIDADFETQKATLSEGVHPARLRVLHILVYRTVREDPFEPIAAAREFAAYMGLETWAIGRFFTRPSRADAETICANVAEFDLCGSKRTRVMPRAQAETFASAWMAHFEEGATVFSNVSSPASPVDFGSNGGLFGFDCEAGVLAVSPTKAGLFWSAENS